MRRHRVDETPVERRDCMVHNWCVRLLVKSGYRRCRFETLVGLTGVAGLQCGALRQTLLAISRGHWISTRDFPHRGALNHIMYFEPHRMGDS